MSKQNQFDKNKEVYPYLRYVMMDFNIENLQKFDLSYIKTPKGYQADDTFKNVFLDLEKVFN